MAETKVVPFYGPGSASEKAKANVALLANPAFISQADEERKKKKRAWAMKGKPPEKPPAGVAQETKTFYDRKSQTTALAGE
jgi:hypothetical protein